MRAAVRRGSAASDRRAGDDQRPVLPPGYRVGRAHVRVVPEDPRPWDLEDVRVTAARRDRILRDRSAVGGVRELDPVLVDARVSLARGQLALVVHDHRVTDLDADLGAGDRAVEGDRVINGAEPRQASGTSFATIVVSNTPAVRLTFWACGRFGVALMSPQAHAGNTTTETAIAAPMTSANACARRRCVSMGPASIAEALGLLP